MSHEIEKLLNNQDFLAPDVATGRFSRPYAAMFKDLQSNILTPHGLSLARYFLIRFKDGDEHRDDIRELLATLAQNQFERLMFHSATVATGSSGPPDRVRRRLRALIDRRAARAATMPKNSRVSKTKGTTNTQTRESPQSAADGAETQKELLAKFRVVSEDEMYWRRQEAYDRASKIGEDSEPIAPELGESSSRDDPPAAPPYCVNVLLTFSAYEKLGESDSPTDPAFRAGMPARGPALLNDDPTKWEGHYGLGVDALIVVSFNDGADAAARAAIDKDLEAFKALLEEHATVWCESGRQIKVPIPGKTDRQYPIEPFGFRDNISQPLFYDRDRRYRCAGAVNPPHWNPFAPLRLALVPDPGGMLRYSCGSYFVFRKIQQHIDQFYVQSEALAQTRRRWPEDLRAEFVGRKPDGTPLVSHSGNNDFDFSSDPRGNQCPFHSHVRKSNPRGEVRGEYGTRERRIVRRGIPFGPEIRRDETGKPIKHDAGGKVIEGRVEYLDRQQEGKPIGLLFLCAQRDIAAQFEAIQASWQNQPNHPVGRSPGADTVCGQQHGSTMIEIQYEEPGTGRRYSKGRDATYAQVVTVLGGEYFFAPSISFLRALLESFWT